MEGIEQAESTGLGKEAGGWEWLLGIQMFFEKNQNILSSKSNDLCTAATKTNVVLSFSILGKTSEIPMGVKKFVGEECPFYFFLIN